VDRINDLRFVVKRPVPGECCRNMPHIKLACPKTKEFIDTSLPYIFNFIAKKVELLFGQIEKKVGASG